MVLVSIIMSLYNHEKFVSEAIESVLNQSFKDFELIIIDDCSKDRSQEIVKKYEAKDNRINFIIHKQNMGIAKTTNDGLDLSKGKFIAFLDSDDVWNERKLERQIKVLEKDENLIIWTEGQVINMNSEPTEKTFTEVHYATKKKKSGNIFNELLILPFIFKSSLILKKKNIGSIRFNEELTILDDYQFELSLARKYKYHFINEPLTKYRRHYTNITYKRQVVIDDLVKLRIYLLEKYDNIILKSIKWHLNLDIINRYLMYGEKGKSRSHIYKLVKIYPHNPLIYWYFIKSLIKSDFLLKILHLLLLIIQKIMLLRIQCINRSFLDDFSFFESIMKFKSLGGYFFKHLFFLGDMWKLKNSF